jgi:hypothetical protein
MIFVIIDLYQGSGEPLKALLLLTATFFSLQALTLEESVAYTFANNTLKQSDVEIKASRALRDNKRAQIFGRPDLLSSYDHYNLPQG